MANGERSTPALVPADAALDGEVHLAAGTGVVVHCHGGTGRTGTVIGATLVTLGHDPDVVVEWLDEVHRRHGRAGWPETPWQAGSVRSLG